MRAGDRWVDRNAGSVVRPYALTGGRTEPATGESLSLIALVASSCRAAHAGAGDPADLSPESPEHRGILALCRQPATVADVVTSTGLPVGVVRVLLADLILRGQITVLTVRSADEQPGADLLREVLRGLRAL